MRKIEGKLKQVKFINEVKLDQVTLIEMVLILLYTYGSSGVNCTGSPVNCGSKFSTSWPSSTLGLNGGVICRASNLH